RAHHDSGRQAPRPETVMGSGPNIYERFRQLSSRVAAAVGSPWAFALAVVAIVAWAVTGPLFDFSDTWQLIITIRTTVVTFQIVFLIQHTQNKDARAIQLKLNERSDRGA